jgi:putative endonuclease
MSNISFGFAGQSAAEKYLKDLGYAFLGRNFRTRWGEIDLIFRDGGCLVFAEVKTRRDASYGEPEEAVTYAKQRHLIAASQIYLNQKKTPSALWRIDVLSLVSSCHPRESGDPRFIVRHLKNAVTG